MGANTTENKNVKTTEGNDSLRKLLDWLFDEGRKAGDSLANKTGDPWYDGASFGRLQAIADAIDRSEEILGIADASYTRRPKTTESKKALADASADRNPFLLQRDELTTMDMHTCDLCGKWVPSPVYQVLLAFNGQSKVATEVCADCMNHLKFKLTKTVPMEAYRDYERWVSQHPVKAETE